MIRVDPADLDASVNLSAECLPPIESTDIFPYLVLVTSFYTKEQFKNFKSLEAHKWLTSGFVIGVQRCVVAEKFVVLSKVKHSQRMNDPAISTWIIASKEGTVLSAHCMDCKAGLAESCSHVASILFYIEAWARIHENLACTQVKYSWLLPKRMKPVALSLVPPYNKEFILPSRNIPSIRELFEPSLLELSYPDLLKKWFAIKLTLSSEQVCQIEKDTRDQGPVVQNPINANPRLKVNQ